ncbi:unnamed protein product, partial [marine sediment metagenome]
MHQVTNHHNTTWPATKAELEQYSIATPYGVLTISNHGRRISFELFDDIRQSEHNIALHNYIQQLKRRGVTKFNNDHIAIPGANRSYSLVRGRAKLDAVYYRDGRIHELELKTTQQIGSERTHKQLLELAKHCHNLILVVRRGDQEEAATIVNMVGLATQIKVDTYEIYEEED